MLITDVLISLIVLILDIFYSNMFYFCLISMNWVIHAPEQISSKLIDMIFKKSMNEFLEDLLSMSDN